MKIFFLIILIIFIVLGLVVYKVYATLRRMFIPRQDNNAQFYGNQYPNEEERASESQNVLYSDSEIVVLKGDADDDEEENTSDEKYTIND